MVPQHDLQPFLSLLKTAVSRPVRPESSDSGGQERLGGRLEAEEGRFGREEEFEELEAQLYSLLWTVTCMCFNC